MFTFEGKNLSESSRKNYIARIRNLEKVLGVGVDVVAKGASVYLPKIREKWPNEKTQRGYYSLLLTLGKHYDVSVDKEWREAFDKLGAKMDEEIAQNKPSERQAGGIVSWGEITRTRDHLAEGSYDRLLLSMYTFIPPMRADYGQVRIYTTRAPMNAEGNYMVVSRGGVKMVIGEHKTSRSVGPVKQDLPTGLVSVIRASLKQHPREWLFVGKNGDPMSDTAFTKWANRRLAALTGKPTTIGLLRHIYISSLPINTMSIAERAKVAYQMGQVYKPSQQDRYRFVD